MLILFKPWHCVRDLREEGQSRADSLASFFEHSDPTVKHIMDNFQLLHKCKDSRDDHFSARRAGGRCVGTEIPGEIIQPDIDADDIVPETNEHLEDAILHHLQSIEVSRSLWSTASTNKAVECLSVIDDVGLYSTEFSPVHLPADVSLPAHSVYSDKDEAVWTHEYER